MDRHGEKIEKEICLIVWLMYTAGLDVDGGDDRFKKKGSFVH